MFGLKHIQISVLLVASPVGLVHLFYGLVHLFYIVYSGIFPCPGLRIICPGVFSIPEGCRTSAMPKSATLKDTVAKHDVNMVQNMMLIWYSYEPWCQHITTRWKNMEIMELLWTSRGPTGRFHQINMLWWMVVAFDLPGPQSVGTSTTVARYPWHPIHVQGNKLPYELILNRKQCNSTWLWRVACRISANPFFEVPLTLASGQTPHACGHRNTWTKGQWPYIPNRCLPGSWFNHLPPNVCAGFSFGLLIREVDREITKKYCDI